MHGQAGIARDVQIFMVIFVFGLGRLLVVMLIGELHADPNSRNGGQSRLIIGSFVPVNQLLISIVASRFHDGDSDGCGSSVPPLPGRDRG